MNTLHYLDRKQDTMSRQPTSNLPRILLIDWDDEFALQLKEAAQHVYQIEHLISAPELQLAINIEPAPVAILLDIDTFRLGTETRLLDLRRLLPDVVYVLLSRAPQVMMELSLDMGPALMVHKDNSLHDLLRMISQLAPNQEHQPHAPQASVDHTHSISDLTGEFPFAQIVTLQRHASIGLLGQNLGNELNNMNTVLMSVAAELQQITERTMGQEDEELIPVLLQDLSWISQNLKQYADSLVALYTAHSTDIQEIDLKQRVVDVLHTLEGIGKTKYIGINPRLGDGEITVCMSPVHLDQILHNLLVTISNAVRSNHATRRSVDILLVNDPNRKLAQLSFHVSAEFEHFRRIEQALKGNFANAEMLATYIAKRLIDTNGGELIITPETQGGFSMHIEFPFPYQEVATAPSLYRDQELLDYEYSYDEFVRLSTQLK